MLVPQSSPWLDDLGYLERETPMGICQEKYGDDDGICFLRRNKWEMLEVRSWGEFQR